MDLKPSNIMIIPDADVLGGERVKVLDFGIAKLSSNQVPGQVDTRTGAILGSPRYMSPEQARNVSTVDERSDIYSLGAILYEMLSGQPPFVAESDAETMAMHLYAEPLPLQQRDPHIQPELAAFVHRMLRKTADAHSSEQCRSPAATKTDCYRTNDLRCSFHLCERQRTKGPGLVQPSATQEPHAYPSSAAFARSPLRSQVAIGPMPLTSI